MQKANATKAVALSFHYGFYLAVLAYLRVVELHTLKPYQLDLQNVKKK